MCIQNPASRHPSEQLPKLHSLRIWDMGILEKANITWRENQLKLLQNKCDLLCLIYSIARSPLKHGCSFCGRPHCAVSGCLSGRNLPARCVTAQSPSLIAAIQALPRPYIYISLSLSIYIYIFYKISDLMPPLCTLHFMLSLRCCLSPFIFFFFSLFFFC